MSGGTQMLDDSSQGATGELGELVLGSRSFLLVFPSLAANR